MKAYLQINNTIELMGMDPSQHLIFFMFLTTTIATLICSVVVRDSEDAGFGLYGYILNKVVRYFL